MTTGKHALQHRPKQCWQQFVQCPVLAPSISRATKKPDKTYGFAHIHLLYTYILILYTLRTVWLIKGKWLIILVSPSFFSARAFEQFATWLSQISVYGSARWDWCCIKCSRYKHVTVKHSIVKTTCQIMGVQNIFIAQKKKSTLKSSNRIIINRRSEQSKYLHPNLPLLCINLYSSNSHTSFATPVQKCHEQGIKFCVKAN